jgi:UDP-N-acetyl-D-mannosaminuronate dehydrogenase/intein/homing endonuclease
MSQRAQEPAVNEGRAEELYRALLDKVRGRRARVGIIGLGYVGLPLARAFAHGGFPVIGFDVDSVKVQKLGRGESYIGHIGPDVVGEMKVKGFQATTDFGRLAEADAVIICVPTPLTEAREPDLSYIVKSVEAIAARLRPGQLVVLESTTYPGTTRDVAQPILEATGLKAGQDFFLAFSPEREDPGNPSFSAPTIPKVVGGVGPRGLELAATLYGQVVVKVIRVPSPEVAEACKILENTYRAINIALVNELKVLFDRMGIDVWEVIEAAKTKPFGFQAFYPGPGLGGHCLAGGETVCVRDAEGVHVLRFADLFARFEVAARRRPDGVEAATVRGLETLSVDPGTGQACFAPVTHLFRRAAPSPLLRLRLRGNRSLTVTDGHPMLVCYGDRIEVRQAADVLPGTPLVVLATWPAESRGNPEIDLMDVAFRTELQGRLRVQPRTGRWQDHDGLVRPALAGTGMAAKDVYRHNTLPLEVYLRLERDGTAPFSRKEVLLSSGKGRSWNQVPAVLPINESFARLIGYYLSEGCITEDGALRMRLSFGSHEQELIGDASALLTQFGFRHSVHRLRGCATVQLKVSSRLLGVLLRDVLGCGVRSEDARIPARLLGGPEPVRRGLLAGLLRGDGDVFLESRVRAYRARRRVYRHRLHAATVGYFTSSPILFQQVILLLQGFGWIPTFHPTKPHVRVCGQQVEALEPLLAGAKQVKLRAYREGRTRQCPARSYARHDSFATVEVKTVERVAGEAVYSMEVAGTEAFVTSYGIAVHNCIPIDPFYLTWVARKYGLTTRFIELAGEVNTAMPHYVVAKVADALNDRGKPVKGSKVALLGMAYKKDVDDPRESPGFELMELLLHKGALVTYNDPHIPVLPRMRRWPDLHMTSQPLTAEYLQAQDCVLVVTDHSAYDWPWVVKNAQLLVDTRNATKAVTEGRERIVKG